VTPRETLYACVRFSSDAADDPIRVENWVPAMDAFVSADARVIGRAQLDAAGCALVHVEADDGTWVWRVRDLLPPE